MTRLLIVLLATTAASPALAQHSGHAQPSAAQVQSNPLAGRTQPTQPPAAPAASTCTPEHAAMGHCTMPAATPTPPAAPASTCTPEHAAMGHCTMPPTTPAPAPPPASTCTAEHAAMGHCTMPAQQQSTADPHAGHAAPAQQADPHAGHQMSGSRAAPPAPPVGPPPAAAFSGPENAADTVFGAAQMQPSRRELIRSHGRMTTSRFRAERFEVGVSGGEETYAWEADFFTGEPLDRLWIKTEGEGAFGGELEHGEVQALWGHAISPFFDLQAGLRYDFAPDPQRAHLVLGIQGLAPNWIEVDAAAFLSNEGELTARIEAEYDLRITQRLILQPLVEIELSAQDIPELGIGAGLSSTEVGLRLRYEVQPEFAPYIGVEWEQAYGQTADYREAAGEDAGGVRFLAGVRVSF